MSLTAVATISNAREYRLISGFTEFGTHRFPIHYAQESSNSSSFANYFEVRLLAEPVSHRITVVPFKGFDKLLTDFP